MAKQSASVVPGDPALVYEILTGYEDIAEWMPHVAAVKLLAKEGDLVLAEVQMQGQKQRRFTMECIHSRDKEVIWRPVESDIPISQVRWDLAATPEGHCTVSLAIDRRLSLARFTWGGIRFAEPRQWLRALRNQVSLFQPGLQLPDSDGEKILEIVETKEGLVCWIRGRKYNMVAAAAEQPR
jgi:ribosome-associated toxin RatA of RatAB toxin-antitoxin module